MSHIDLSTEAAKRSSSSWSNDDTSRMSMDMFCNTGPSKSFSEAPAIDV
jgi:hypothetical protein